MPTLADETIRTPVPKNGTNGHAARSLTYDELVKALMREPGKAEIINGRIKRLDMTGDEPALAGFVISIALRNWVKGTQANGIAYPDGVAFLCDLPHRQSFSPDASYYTGARGGAKFLPTPPVFAAEVRSENDYGNSAEIEMEKKRTDYFATGTTEVVWDVDVLRGEEIIRKFTKAGGAATPVATFKRGDTANAEPAVPGFAMKVDDLFE